MSTPEKDKWDKIAKELLPLDSRDRKDVAAALRELGGEIERLTHELLRIGDIAIINWDDATDGEVDKTGVQLTKTYIEMRRAELKQIEAMRAFVGDEMARSDYKSVADMRDEIDHLKAELLAEAERVTERDCAIIKNGGHRIHWVEACALIRVAQAQEREG